MDMLYWKKMPSLWVGNSIASFNDLETAHAIAALKIYIVFSLFSKSREDGVRTIAMTFTEISETASLSRALVNEGLKVLYQKEMIKNLSPTPRKKLYTVDVAGELLDGWCKLPFAGVVSKDRSIVAFKSMHNRYPFELVALQLYVYLLYARDNRNDYTLARKFTIMEKLHCRLHVLNKAITYLIHIGLLKAVKQKVVEQTYTEIFHDSFYFYMAAGAGNAFTYQKSPKVVPPAKEIPF